MKIRILTIGKLKEKYLVNGINEYVKRLNAYCKVELVEVPDEPIPDNASENVENIIKDKEADKIVSKIKDDEYVIVLDLHGKEIDSEKVYMGGEYMFVEIQNKCIFPRLSKKFCDFNKLSLYLTMYTMEEGKIWIEDDMKEILKIIKEGKYYIGTENREED